MYVLDPSIREKLENALQLEPQERGYEILLIEPYYKTLLNKNRWDGKEIGICQLLLTFLDLYHSAKKVSRKTTDLLKTLSSLDAYEESYGAHADEIRILFQN